MHIGSRTEPYVNWLVTDVSGTQLQNGFKGVPTCVTTDTINTITLQHMYKTHRHRTL
jgi:hypothetical protein